MSEVASIPWVSSMDIWIRCMDLWIYEYMDKIYGYLDIWIYGYMNIYIILAFPVYHTTPMFYPPISSKVHMQSKLDFYFF